MADELTPHPRMRLSRLRDIGWREWDPIGLLGPDELWEDVPYADEYDKYLRQAAANIRLGTPYEEVIDYLVQIEAEHMGLGLRTDARTRAAATVLAIGTCTDLWGEA